MQDQNQPNPPTGGPTPPPAGGPADATPQPAVNPPQSIPKTKESEPIASPVAESDRLTVEAPEITPSHTPEVKIPQELESVMEKSPADKELIIPKEVMLPPPKPSVPAITTPAGTIRLPTTYTQALQKQTTTKISDSSHWLAALTMYLWRKYDPDAVNEAKKQLKKAA